jgi:DNA-binding MarR family transcriptional regulator
MSQSSYTNGLLFTKAYKFVRVAIYEVLEKYGLNPSYWAILGIVVTAPEGVRLATVAREMEVKAPLVTMLAGDLIEKGLILRVPHHSDKRAKLLVATNKGKKVALEVEGELSLRIAKIMHGVSAADAAAFRRTLERIIDNTRD